LNPKLAKALQIILPLGLGVFLIWYSYNLFSPEQLVDIEKHFRNANYSWVLLSVTFALLSHFSRAYRWNYMLEPLGYRPRYGNNVMAVGIAYLVNNFIPRGGEASRALVLQRYENIPFDKGIGTIIAERVADFLILMLLVVIAVVSQFDLLSTYIIENLPKEKIIIAIVALTVLIIATFLFFRYSNNPFSKKVKQFLLGIKEGVFSILNMKNVAGFLFHTVFIWVMYLLMFYVCIYALPETSHLSIPVLIVAFVVGSFAVVFTNGGFGSYPPAVAGILLLYNIPFEVGTAFGWIIWISQFAMILIFGGLSFLILPFYNRKKAQKIED